jgi:integrase/regulator of replication initiation timing
LTQKAGEGLIEFKNRAARFEREIEKFHSYLLAEGFTINTARNLTIGIRQIFRYYQMPTMLRRGSKATKTTKTTRSFPLAIEHARAMFRVANLRERVILSIATDLALRIGDFLAIRQDDLPSLDQEPPVSFDVMTDKEDVVAHGFLSQETVDLLKVYLPTLEKKKENAYLFPSNGESHISDEWMNRLLQNLAVKAQINLNGKDLTFHCFRKMFLSAAIDSGIGLTAGKKLCGKAIAESDDTYLTTVHLKEKFIQLKKFLSIEEQPKVEAEKIESLKGAVNKLQEELTQQKIITDTISETNIKMKKDVEQIPVMQRQNETLKTDNEQLKHEMGNLKEMLERFHVSDIERDMAEMRKIVEEVRKAVESQFPITALFARNGEEWVSELTGINKSGRYIVRSKHRIDKKTAKKVKELLQKGSAKKEET